MSGEGFGGGKAAMRPRHVALMVFVGFPSERAAMFDSLLVTFVGAGFLPAAWNGAAWGVRKLQFFLKNLKKKILNLPRNNGEFLSSPASSPAGILGYFPSQGAEGHPIPASTTCLQPLW